MIPFAGLAWRLWVYCTTDWCNGGQGMSFLMMNKFAMELLKSGDAQWLHFGYCWFLVASAGSYLFGFFIWTSRCFGQHTSSLLIIFHLNGL